MNQNHYFPDQSMFIQSCPTLSFTHFSGNLCSLNLHPHLTHQLPILLNLLHLPPWLQKLPSTPCSQVTISSYHRHCQFQYKRQHPTRGVYTSVEANSRQQRTNQRHRVPVGSGQLKNLFTQAGTGQPTKWVRALMSGKIRFLTSNRTELWRQLKLGRWYAPTCVTAGV